MYVADWTAARCGGCAGAILMAAIELQTPHLRLVLKSHEGVIEMIEAMTAYERAQISADWLAQFDASIEADPWLYPFDVVHRASGEVVGTCSFKGPPADGVVEIAYGIEPDHQSRGYATEAARALVDYAFTNGGVRVVRAHTLPDAVASKRVLEKCGFRYVGDVDDPEDGTVCRFDRGAA